MVAESRELVKQFFDGEDARRRRDLVLIWGLVIVVDAALLVAFLQGMAVDAMLRIFGPVLGVAVVLGYLLSMASWRRKRHWNSGLNECWTPLNLLGTTSMACN